MKVLLIVQVFILIAFNCFADEFKADLGKVSKDEIKMEFCPIDSGANAAILFDIGRSEVKFIPDEGFVLEFKRHIRIKIFNKEGYDRANVEIMLYKTGSDREKLTHFKGYTHNLDGKSMEREKITNRDGNQEDINEHWFAEKFSMPGVREGSIIEYEYTVKSPFVMQLQDWQMQYEIPVIRSEYTVEFPEYFWYNKHYRGSVALDKNEYSTSVYQGVGAFRQEANSNMGNLSKTEVEVASYDYKTHVYHFLATNTPGLKEEPFMPDIDNFYAEISFELAYTDIPGSLRKNYTQTWEGVNEMLLKDSEFGVQLNSSGYARDFIKPLLSEVKDPIRRAKAIYEHVRDRMKWNDWNSIYVASTLRKAYRERSGNSADINVMLVSLMREAGIEAYPVLISTRNNGHIQFERPSIAQFNYVIALARINGNDFFIDATDPHYPFSMLPERCINGDGRLIDEKSGNWVTVKPGGMVKEVVSSNLVIDDNGVLTGKISKIKSEYASIDFRNKVKNANGMDDFISSLSEKNPGLSIKSYNVENIDSLSAPVKVEYDIILDNHSRQVGDFIYLDPLITEKMEENPFKPEKRVFPVDLVYPNEHLVSVNIKVPEGYTVESLPQATAVKLPEKGGMFLFSCNKLGNNISVTSRIALNKAFFTQNEYPYLKEFFNQVVAKHAEQIVLKKKS